jgi:hypothetical protein
MIEEVRRVAIIIAVLAITAFVAASALFGNDSRGGNDWRWHARS